MKVLIDWSRVGHSTNNYQSN